MKRRALAMVLAAGVTLPAGSYGESSEAPTAEESAALELEAIKKTEVLLDDKYAARKAEMTTRVRAMYKLSRASWPRIWFEPEVRERTSRWLGAARRITRRDIAELELLANEIAITAADEARLRATSWPESGGATALRWPVEDSKIVSSFGDYTGPSPRVRLRRRGVLLRARPGHAVFAPAAGRVRYLGPISGLGQSLIIEHGPPEAPTGLTVLGGIKDSQVQPASELRAGQPMASALRNELYLEYRVGTLARSQPVDPAPLLEP